MSAPSNDDWPVSLTEDGGKVFLRDTDLVPENQLEDLIHHWDNAQLMHPGRDKLQKDLYTFSAESVLRGVCGLQGHQASRPVNSWKPPVQGNSRETHEVDFKGCPCDAISNFGRRGL